MTIQKHRAPLRAAYDDVYHDRLALGVKAKTPVLLQWLFIVAGLAVLVLFLLLPILDGQELDLKFVALGAALFVPAFCRFIFWCFYEKKLIAAELGKIILFPRSSREVVLNTREIIKIRRHNFLGFRYRAHNITIYTKQGERYKIHFLKESAQVASKMEQLRFGRIS